jgi:hypothetical protein
MAVKDTSFPGAAFDAWLTNEPPFDFSDEEEEGEDEQPRPPRVIKENQDDDSTPPF